MLRAYEAIIAPENKRLSEMLGESNASQFLCQSYYDDNHKIQNCTCGRCGDDYTVIPVTVVHSSGTTQIVEDGLVMECDHKGAYEQTKSELRLEGSYISGNYETYWNDVDVLTCDKCDAQMGDDGEWYE